MGKQKEDRDMVKQKKVFVRMTKNEFEQIKQNAELFGQGNVSRWIRERALDVSIKADEVKSKK